MKKKHIDAHLHVRGESTYVDDLPPAANQLYGQPFGSPVAHGRLAPIDTGPALDVDGVVAVFTAADIPGDNLIGPIIQDEVLLAEGTVNFVGQPIALVVATSAEAARAGVRRLSADIDPLRAVVNPRDAFEAGSIIDEGRTLAMGDVDAAWDDCDVIVEGTCDIGGQEHLYLETHRARAVPGEDETAKVYASTQSPYAAQKTIAHVLGVPEHKVEVDVVRLGGGFGGKEDQATHWACLAALAAAATGRPVEIVLHRMDDLAMTGKRHPYQCDYKLGLKRDGTFVALDVKHYQNAGAYADLSTAVLERTLFHSTNSYFIPNARIFAVCCRTHLPPNTAFRGFGGPQAMFVVESAIARAAEVMDVSRESLQRHNLLKENDLFTYGQPAEDCRAVRTWQELDQWMDLGTLRAGIDAYNRDHRATKKGMAVMPVCFGISFTKTFLNQAGALVLVYTDGSVSVANGGVEMGQGNATKIRDIAAASLGIDESRVRSESTNTRRVANMSPSAASATSDLNGFATMDACRKIMVRLTAFAAEKLGAPSPEAVAVRDENVLVDGEPAGWDWARLVREAYLHRIDLSAHGFFSTPRIHFDRESETGRPFAYHTYGAACIEVAIDCLRGTYALSRIRIVHDVGRPVNPTVDIGQVEGGLAQGLGWVSLEDLQFAPDGRYLSNTLSTYKVPDVYFMPDDLEVRLLDRADNPYGPLGSKAVGEPPLMYGIGMYFALRDAIRAYRPDQSADFASPMTPERVLHSLHPDLVREIEAGVGRARET